MATKTFTQLTAYASTLASDDEIAIWDASAAAARKVTVANFIANSPNGGLAELGGAQTLTGLKRFDGGVLLGAQVGSYGALLYRYDTDRIWFGTPGTTSTQKIQILSSAGGSIADFFGDGAVLFYGSLGIADGIVAPSTISGRAQIYVDTADGDLKIKFGDGTTKTIVVDS